MTPEARAKLVMRQREEQRHVESLAAIIAAPALLKRSTSDVMAVIRSSVAVARLIQNEVER